MRLRDELLSRVGLQRRLDPIYHISGDLGLLEVLIEGVHAVEAKDHRIVAELDHVVATLTPSLLNCGVRGQSGVRRDVLEHNLPHVVVVQIFDISVRRLVVIHNIIVADDGQDRHRGKGSLDRCDSFNHRQLHHLPVRIRQRYAFFNCKMVLAEISNQEDGLEGLTAGVFKLGRLGQNKVQRPYVRLCAWFTVVVIRLVDVQVHVIDQEHFVSLGKSTTSGLKRN